MVGYLIRQNFAVMRANQDSLESHRMSTDTALADIRTEMAGIRAEMTEMRAEMKQKIGKVYGKAEYLTRRVITRLTGQRRTDRSLLSIPACDG